MRKTLKKKGPTQLQSKVAEKLEFKSRKDRSRRSIYFSDEIWAKFNHCCEQMDESASRTLEALMELFMEDECPDVPVKKP